MTTENQLNQLEILIKEIEDGETDLDTAVEKYSQVVKLAAKALQQLNKTEQKLLVLKKEGNELLTQDLSK